MSVQYGWETEPVDLDSPMINLPDNWFTAEATSDLNHSIEAIIRTLD